MPYEKNSVSAQSQTRFVIAIESSLTTVGLADGERVGFNDGLTLGILRMKMFEIIGKSNFNMVRRKLGTTHSCRASRRRRRTW